MVAISTLSGDLDSADWRAPTGGGAVGGGGAYVTFPSGTSAATLITAITGNWDLSQGSWTFKFQSLPTAGACAVLLRNLGGTVHGVYLSRNTSTGNWDYVARMDSANTALGTVTAAHLTSNPYIRMRQVVGGPNTTGTFYLDTSPDGTTWTNQIATVGPTGTNAPSVFIGLEPGFHVTSALTGAWRVQNVNGAADPPPEISSNPSSIPSAGTWLTTTNVYTSDNTYATNVGTTQNTEYPLDVGGFNFSAIPAGSTIGSVTVTIEAKTGTAARAQIKGELYDGATLLTGSLALTNLTAADANYTFAPTATLAQLQSANLKVRVTNKRTASQASTTSVDWVKIDVTYTPPATVTQAAYRFYADGTETGATALAAQDTAYTADVSAGDTNLLLRTRLQSTNATPLGATDDWQLQWEKNASGTWNDVGFGSLVDSYAETNADGFSLLTTSTDISGQSFLGTGTKLTRAGFWLRKVGAPPGTITALLYAHTGTFGSTGVGTGSPLATATARSASGFSTTAQWEDFDFDGTFTLAAGTPYVIAVKTSTDTDPSNYVALALDNSAPTHAGTSSDYISPNPSWIVSSARDLVFRVYGSDPAAAVVPYASANLTDGAATTNRLGAGTGSFTAGEVSETGVAADLGWPGNNYTEVLYALTLVKAALANSDTVRFRVLRNGATTGLTYTAVPTVPVTIGAGGTTPVTITRSTTWNVKGQPTITRAASWDVTTAVSLTRVVTWDARVAVAITRDTTWRNRAAAGLTRGTTWRTEQAVALTRSTTWDTRLAVSLSRQASWNVAAPTPVPVTITRSTTWRAAQTVALTRSATWDARTAVAVTRSATWDVTAAVALVRSTTWRARAVVTQVRSTTWDVTTSVAQTRSTTWRVRAPVAVTRAATWDVLTSVAAVTRSTTWRVRSAVAVLRSTTWDVLAAVTTVRSASWDALAPVALTRSATWDARLQVTLVRQTSWNVAGQLTQITVLRSTTWKVVGRTTVLRSASWDVLSARAVTRPATWRVASAVTATRAATWDTRRAVALARQASWDANARVTLIRLTSWNVAAPSAPISKGTVVVGGVKKTVVNRWVIVGGVKKPVVAASVIVGGVKKTTV